MSKEFSHDLQSARSMLRRWVWKTSELDDRTSTVVTALALLDSLDLPETIDVIPVAESIKVGGLLFEVA